MSGGNRKGGALGRYVAMNLFSIALGLCNILLFYVIFYREAFAEAEALRRLVELVTRLANSVTSNLILMGALVFAAVLVPVNNRENLKDSDGGGLSGRELNACTAFLNAVLLLCSYPLIQLGLYAFRWGCWLFCVVFLQFGDVSWIDRMGEFLGSQKFRTPAAVGITVFLFCKLVLWRITANPFRKGGAAKQTGKAAEPAEREGCALPVSYESGLRYVNGEGAKQYIHSFQNSMHLLLWVTETMEKGIAKMGDSGSAAWTVSSPDLKEACREFATDAKIRGVKWNDFCVLCASAAQGWRARGEFQRAAHCDEALVHAADVLAKEEAWPYRGPLGDTKTVQEAYDRLIELYRFGRDGVEVSTEKAVDLAGDCDAFLRGAARSAEKGEKAIDEAIQKAKEESGTSARPSAEAPARAGGLAHEWGTDALPDLMTAHDADGTPHVYHRMNRASDYPAWYTCPDGAPDAMIFTAAVSAGSAFTDCGEFQL